MFFFRTSVDFEIRQFSEETQNLIARGKNLSEKVHNKIVETQRICNGQIKKNITERGSKTDLTECIQNFGLKKSRTKLS